MLFGERGFVLSNPTLLLALPAAAWARAAESETVCFGLWGVGVWLVYAALSNNYGGVCCDHPLVRAAAGAGLLLRWPCCCATCRNSGSISCC